MRLFGSTRQSLDHRLREAEDVRETFDAVLDAINYRIENCTSSLEALDPEQPSGVLTDVNQVFQQALRGIADQISLLHKLSNSIRRASKELQDVEAAKAPRICDDDGNDAEEFLRQVLLHYISDRFPTTSQVIQQRLADTMVLRRKRILYRRSRYPIHVRSEPARPRVAVPRAQSTARPRTENVHRETSDGLSQTASVSKAQSATTLAAEKFHRAAAPSAVSVSRTVALSNHEELIFPSAPTAAIKRKQRELVRQREDELFEVKRRLEDQDRAEDRTPTQDWETAIDAVREVLCPFCFHVIPAREAVDELKWKYVFYLEA
ncbi:hypothetical protein Daus18300_009062 [Diaporthe australafricana]|uniref:Uncharacterized protein n=1 Tax=Diaporthe australafricana TaxID=127596 RepID=A0ABR3WG39_9PEZI